MLFHDDGQARFYLGDVRAVLRELEPESVDAVVTDPPYELTAGKRGGSGPASVNENSPAGRSRVTTGFMGKAWDGSGVSFEAATWTEVLRVAKPGAHLVAFGGTRTYHRLACALEDAGWEIRDSLMWLFGTGFPKSLNGPWGGTALKPGYEPIVLARKPLRGTVAANVTEYGTGGLNIDGCRIAGEPWKEGDTTGLASVKFFTEGDAPVIHKEPHELGRWPANVVLDEAAAALLDASTGETGGFARASGPTLEGPLDKGLAFGARNGTDRPAPFYGDRGGPSRFYYTSKASRSEREAGLHDLEAVRRTDGRAKDIENPRLRTNERKNHHPTVKPLDLMRWLCRLVTPPGGLILDPFLGSGTTAIAAKDEGFRCVGIDLSAEYLEMARRRCAQQGFVFEGAS